MKKYVIMFKGGVETQEYFSIEMSKTFEEYGYEVYWFDLIVSADSANRLIKFYEQNSSDKFIVFTFNFNGIAGEDGIYSSDFGNKKCFWNYADIHIYNMVIDHPLYYHKYVPLIPEKYTQISIDRNHIKYVRQYFPELDTAGEYGFVPLGGTEINVDGSILADKKYLPMEERNIDVIFTGNYTPPERFLRYLDGMSEEYRQIYMDILDMSLQNPNELIEELAKQKLLEVADDFSYEELKNVMPNLMFIDLSVRFHYRGKVIAALADSGIKVHTFGAGWNLLECKQPENIITAGSVDSQTCLDMLSWSKISVNVMPWFKDGAHDRIFNTMLNGAVSLSDTSKYLLEEFTDNKDILFYSLTDTSQLGERVKMLLSDANRLQQLADNGYKKCISRHTWRERTKYIIENII